jgi:hypothetical protein
VNVSDLAFTVLAGVVPLVIAVSLLPGLNTTTWWRAPACWAAFVGGSIFWLSILLPSIAGPRRGLTHAALGLVIAFAIGFAAGVALMARFHWRARRERGQRGFDVTTGHDQTKL